MGIFWVIDSSNLQKSKERRERDIIENDFQAYAENQRLKAEIELQKLQLEVPYEHEQIQ